MDSPQRHRRFWAWPAELERAGILGINQRNLGFVQAANPRHHYPTVDNKVLTKGICHKNGIPVPDTYCVLRRHGDLQRFLDILGNRQQFVVKPASGAAGRGILVIAQRDGLNFFTPSGRLITWNELRYHLSTVLSGLFSLGGQIDHVIVEQLIIQQKSFQKISVGGTPDVRVILYRRVPVMAMIRLPTIESGGRANLHQGAAAAAINLVTGVTFGGVCHDRLITRHPDTREEIGGFQIPCWKELLTAAMKLSDALQMQYVGVDFVIDEQDGPVVLEANARPGLAIQLAHSRGLLPVLRKIDSLPPGARTGDRRWEIVAELAG